MTILNLFSKVIHTDEIVFEKKESEKLKNLVIKQEYNNVEDINSSKISKSLYILDDLKVIKTKFENYFNDFQKKYLMYDNEFKMTTSWSTKSSHLNYGNFHNHTNNFYSGIYYIDVDEDTGDIEFCDFSEKMFDLKVKEYNVNNSKSWIFKPRNNMIILFPSQLHHMIHLNRSKKDRYSIAFNFFPMGKIGSSDSMINIKEID